MGSVQQGRLTRFAAIEVKQGETAHVAIGALMRLAKDKGILFAGLELFSTFTVNKAVFVRFRTDLDVTKLREALLESGRGVVLPTMGQYEVVLSGGTKGPYSLSAMHATARVTERRTYRGTGDKFWDRQFSS